MNTFFLSLFKDNRLGRINEFLISPEPARNLDLSGKLGHEPVCRFDCRFDQPFSRAGKRPSNWVRFDFGASPYLTRFKDRAAAKLRLASFCKPEPHSPETEKELGTGLARVVRAPRHKCASGGQDANIRS